MTPKEINYLLLNFEKEAFQNFKNDDNSNEQFSELDKASHFQFKCTFELKFVSIKVS